MILAALAHRGKIRPLTIAVKAVSVRRNLLTALLVELRKRLGVRHYSDDGLYAGARQLSEAAHGENTAIAVLPMAIARRIAIRISCTQRRPRRLPSSKYSHLSARCSETTPETAARGRPREKPENGTSSVSRHDPSRHDPTCKAPASIKAPTRQPDHRLYER